MDKKNIKELIEQYEATHQDEKDVFTVSDIEAIAKISGGSSADPFTLITNSLAAGYMIACADDGARTALKDELSGIYERLHNVLAVPYMVQYALDIQHQGGDALSEAVIDNGLSAMTDSLERIAEDLWDVTKRI